MNDDIPFPPISDNGKTGPLPSKTPASSAQSSLNEEKTNDLEILEWCISIHERKHQYVEGQRHRYMLLLAFFCNDYGISKSFVIQEFIKRYKREDVPEKEIKSIIEHCYSNNTTFGIKQYRKKNSSIVEITNNSILPYSFIQKCLQNNEMGDAELLAALFKDKKLYDHTLCSWITYKKGVWVIDKKKQTRTEVAENLTRTYDQYAQSIHKLIEQAKPDNKDKPDKKTASRYTKLQKLYASLDKRTKSLNTKNRLHNVMDLATSLLACNLEDFDIQPHLLNLSNGIYNFDNGQIISHSPQNLFYHQSPIRFDPKAACPKWEAFLDRIFGGDKDLINFVRCCVAYSLTGYSDFQGFLYCYGKGANGKTVFFGVLRMLIGMGNYYRTIPISALLSHVQDNTTSYYIATLKGSRTAVASEIPKGKVLNESQIKDLTGGERLSGRYPRGNPFEFDPTHTLWLFGNHKLVIKGGDHGIWRRVHMIPFKVTITKSEKKPLSEMLKIFQAELSGIFNWAIEGYEYLQKHGWKFPEAVEQATQKYREESDTLGSFLEGCCRSEVKKKCELKTVFNKYIEWCEEKGLRSGYEDSRAFARELRAEGFEVIKKEGKAAEVFGLELLENKNP